MRIAAGPLTAIALSLQFVSAVAAADSCTLLKPAEIQSALASAPTSLVATSVASGASLCRSRAGKLSLLIRVAPRASGASGEKERKGIEIARKMGAQVEVRTEGDLTCSRMTVPPPLADLGNNLTCTVQKSGQVVGVEVTSPAAADLPSTAVVAGLARKAASRL